MGRSIPRPLVAQAVIVIMAAVLFTGVLTIAGSIPTSNIPEHALRNASVTATPVPGDCLSATVTPAPGHVDRSLVTITPVPESDDRLTATAIPEPARDDMIFLQDMDVRTLPVNISGSGSQTTESFNLLPGAISFDIWNDAPGNLEVWLIFNGERFDRILENGVITEGPVVENIVTGGTYFLDVTGDGEWKINVSKAVSG